MTTYKNTSATFNRIDNRTQVLFAQGEIAPEGDQWIAETDGEFDIEMTYEYNCQHLYTSAGIKYFGWM